MQPPTNTCLPAGGWATGRGGGWVQYTQYNMIYKSNIIYNIYIGGYNIIYAGCAPV
jgi:hypothetical protein